MEDIRKQIDQLSEYMANLNVDIKEIKVALKGYNGTPGLCADHEKLKNEFLAFRRWGIAIVGVLVGSSVINVSLLKLFGG